MIRKPSVLILANCTHASLGLALRNSGVFEKVQTAELFSMAPEGRSAVAETLTDFDYVLSLEHGDKFGPLATSIVKERIEEHLITLPTPFFSGLMPDMAYLNKGNDLARAEALLGDYHSGLILEECKAGLSEADVVERYVSGEAFERLDIRGVWDDGLNELRTRETGKDITLSDIIEERARTGEIVTDFLSFNHPTENIIDAIAAKFIEIVTGSKPQQRLIRKEQHNLYRDAFWPVHPAVSLALDLPIAEEQKFKAPERLGNEHMSHADFARGSYRYFVEDGQVSDFNINTPSYLASRIAKGPIRMKAVPNIEKQIIMTHLGRSGSTVLAKMLAQHPDIHWMDEFFSLMTIRSRETYNFTLEQMLQMANDAACKARSNRSDMLVGYEIKLMNFLQNPSCNLIDFLDATKDSKTFTHIVLRRRNVLRRIFSVYKAMQTTVYHRSSDDTNALDTKRTYRVDFDNLFDPDTGQTANTLVDLIDQAIAREEQVMQNIGKLSIEYLELWYEDDIANDPQVAYRKVLGHIGANELPAKVTLAKTGGDLKDEVSNYQQVAKALAGSRHEWMLQ